MDTNDRYTALCDDLRSLMRSISYSVPCEPREIMAVLAYDIAAQRPWFPKSKDQVDPVRPLLTALDRSVFLVNDGNRNMTLYLDAMYTREIRQLYRFSAVPVETGTLWKRTLRTEKEECISAARRWIADLAEFMDALNEELTDLEAKLPSEIADTMDRDSWKADNEALKEKVLATLA